MGGDPGGLGTGLGREGGFCGIAGGRNRGVIPDFGQLITGAGEGLEDGGAVLDEVVFAKRSGGKSGELREGEFGLPVGEDLVGVKHSIGGTSQPMQAMEGAEEEAAETEVVEAAGQPAEHRIPAITELVGAAGLGGGLCERLERYGRGGGGILGGGGFGSGVRLNDGESGAAQDGGAAFNGVNGFAFAEGENGGGAHGADFTSVGIKTAGRVR